MDVHDAAENILKAVHDDLNGRVYWAEFMENQTHGLTDSAVAEVRGIYNKALIILIDENLCRKVGNNIIELAQKGIDANGDYKKYLKKKNTTTILEKLRRIAPIASFIIVLISFIIGLLKKNADKHAAQKAKTVQTKGTSKK
ncbi:MAG TPA: hypothetical protein VN922_01205 [Bacteroidia bacterium]|nr:hypothetical protein [Bacteroidia bacterium]